jgi:predicted nucleic acid-binding protein
VYADSSFIVSLYLTDDRSSEARHQVQGVPFIILTPFHRAEWLHALGQHQFRGSLTANKATLMEADFLSDESSGMYRHLLLPDGVFELCADLAREYGPRLAMRTLDSLHVACAIALKADRFWTHDERQAKLAKAVGLKN